MPRIETNIITCNLWTVCTDPDQVNESRWCAVIEKLYIKCILCSFFICDSYELVTLAVYWPVVAPFLVTVYLLFCLSSYILLRFFIDKFALWIAVMVRYQLTYLALGVNDYDLYWYVKLSTNGNDQLVATSITLRVQSIEYDADHIPLNAIMLAFSNFQN